jgi:hypothetical protein
MGEGPYVFVFGITDSQNRDAIHLQNETRFKKSGADILHDIAAESSLLSVHLPTIIAKDMLALRLA